MTSSRFVRISTSLIPGAPEISQHYREAGQGAPLLILHGGWGYAFYPFDAQDAQIDALGGSCGSPQRARDRRRRLPARASLIENPAPRCARQSVLPIVDR